MTLMGLYALQLLFAVDVFMEFDISAIVGIFHETIPFFWFFITLLNTDDFIAFLYHGNTAISFESTEFRTVD